MVSAINLLKTLFKVAITFMLRDHRHDLWIHGVGLAVRAKSEVIHWIGSRVSERRTLAAWQFFPLRNHRHEMCWLTHPVQHHAHCGRNTFLTVCPHQLTTVACFARLVTFLSSG
jgi:hypothetical protein